MLSQEGNFVSKIEIKEEPMKSFCPNCCFFPGDGANNDNEFGIKDTEVAEITADDDLRYDDLDIDAPIEEAVRSVSEMNLLESLVSSNFDETREIGKVDSVLNIEIPEILQQGERFSDDQEPPLKRIRYDGDILEKTVNDKEIQTDDQVGKSLERKISHKETQTDNREFCQLQSVVGSKSEGGSSLTILRDLKLILSERKKRVNDLSTSINEASNYLDEIKKILSVPENSLTSTNLPLPPKFSGYESRFDFPEQNRFCKIPIKIQNKSGTKYQYPETVKPFEFRDFKPMSTLSLKKNKKKFGIAVPSSSGKKTYVLSGLNKENQTHDVISFRRI